ncbi:MAG: penicillin-binding protein, partial [Butyrivibrio sp.]|nr:penicillin-binding protein [Butyrivibrio sp.]
LLIVCAGTLVYRLFDLQIVNGENYLNSFQLKIKKEKDIPSTRGNIYDRNGNLLAYNELANSVTIEDVYDTGSNRNSEINATVNKLIDMIEKNGDEVVSDFNIALDENGNFEFTVEDTAKLRFLADIYGRLAITDLKYEEKTKTATEVIQDLATKFGIGGYTNPADKKTFVPGLGYSNERLLKVLTIRYDMNLNSYQKYIDTTVATSVSDKTVADVMENSSELKGVSIVEETARKYVDAEYFSQIIGYTGKVSQDELSDLQKKNPDYDLNDTVGKAGIEQSMETTLQGTKGSETVYVDKVGKVIETSDYVDPVAGNDVYLTIDKDLQEAAYDILEERLAGILVSKIRDTKTAPQVKNSSDLTIPIYDVYNALFNNSVIDTTHFTEKGAGATEQSVYKRFQQKQAAVLAELSTELTDTKTPYDKLPKEYQIYESYIASMLYTDGILDSDAVDKEDKTYIAWTKDETISLNEFLHYAISKNWVNISGLALDNQYSDSEEVYTHILSYISDKLSQDVTFSKKLYKYMIDDGIISGSDCCKLLLEQKVVTLSAAEQKQFEGGAESAYTFILNRVRKLDITPAQLNLDPCSGSMVITDVRNGDVLALVSYPSYDNNKMANGVDAAYYAKLRSDLSKPLYNYATQQKTAPGSTFKMVSATAGLMEGVITTTSTITCVGQFDKITPSPRCWIYPRGHGSLNVSGGIKNSCNYFFYTVGYGLGLQGNTYSSDVGLAKLKKYADMYGLTEKSGIEIDESDPQVSTQDAVRSAIGQGTNAYTTVGLARYVTTVANSGTCYNLTLINKTTDSDGNLLKDYSASVRDKINMPQSDWDAIHTGMRGVVESKAYFNNIGVNVAGKTGTAQERTDRANHALFVGYAPYENPEIAIATRVAYGYSSSYAAQITKDVFQYYYNESKRDEIRSGVAKELDGTSANAD